MRGVILAILCIAYPAAARTDDPNQAWPSGEQLPEDGLANADGAFFGELEVTDIDCESANYVTACGRIDVSRAIWGPALHGSLDMGRRGFWIYGRLGGGAGFDPWFLLGPAISHGESRFSLLVGYRVTDSGWRPSYIYLPFTEGPLPSADQVLAFRSLVHQSDSAELRRQLLHVAADPAGTPLLWEYALRRLWTCGGDVAQRFDLVFSPQLQEAGNAKRLDYAADLLWQRAGADSAKALRFKFLDALESAPNSAAALEALGGFASETSKSRVHWTAGERASLRARFAKIRAAPDNLLRSVPAQQQDELWNTIDKPLSRDGGDR